MLFEIVHDRCHRHGDHSASCPFLRLVFCHQCVASGYAVYTSDSLFFSFLSIASLLLPFISFLCSDDGQTGTGVTSIDAWYNQDPSIGMSFLFFFFCFSSFFPFDFDSFISLFSSFLFLSFSFFLSSPPFILSRRTYFSHDSTRFLTGFLTKISNYSRRFVLGGAWFRIVPTFSSKFLYA